MRMLRTITISVLLLAALPGFTASAFAVDGITLIRQTSTTVFPIVISAPGSYRLATDLKVATTTADAIDITVANVTLDLNGFSIIGPGTGSGFGIGDGFDNATVTNGAVVKMGNAGVDLLGFDNHVEGVRALSNGGNGIVAGDNSRVVGNVASNNASNNSFGSYGITCGGNSLVVGNSANDNGSGAGIATGPGATVVGNSASGNAGFGLALSNQAGYGRNVMQGNRSGCADVGGTSMGDNVCNGILQ